jgi:hypothetical protein
MNREHNPLGKEGDVWILLAEESGFLEDLFRKILLQRKRLSQYRSAGA